VASEGFGTATSVGGIVEPPEAARDAAYFAEGSARVHAAAALRQAACPSCRRNHPEVIARYAEFNAKVAKAKRRALPVGAAVFLLAAVIGAGPAVRELAHSKALLGIVLLAAAALGALTYALLRAPGKRPELPWGSVRFWGAREDGSFDWMPSPDVPLPTLARASHAPAAAVLIGGLAAIAALGMFAVWRRTFTNVYVVDVKDRAVTIDGIDVTRDGSRRGIHDDHVRRFDVRRGKGDEHTVVVGDVTYRLRHDGPFGWVVASNAKANDICFVEREAVYGRDDGKKPVMERIEPVAGVIELARYYDDPFKGAPESVEVEAGRTVRRWAIRTISCESLVDGEDDAGSAQPPGSAAPRASD
jgi:hypothetical protein